MSRYTHSLLLGAGLAAALAACHTSTPTTSVSALSYQVQSSGQHSAAGDPSRAPAQPDAAPAQIGPNDPLRLLDMP